MAKISDLNLEVSKSIRDEVKKTNVGLESVRKELGKRLVESELRTATALTDLAGTIRE